MRRPSCASTRRGAERARERITLLLDADTPSLELGLWAGFEVYDEWGGVPAAGVLTVIGTVQERRVMVVANDATVKAGACFPLTIKKILRAQTIAADNRLPMVYLVDSSGVFLPMQDEVFPDEDDFGRIFRNNAVLSAQGIPQYAAIMGNCVAGGAYLPVLCDTVLMTEGSGLYLAGPALVKAAIGQNISHEDLGGAHVHASYSGTIDYREPDDEACLDRLRRLIALLPADPAAEASRPAIESPSRPAEDIYQVVAHRIVGPVRCPRDAGLSARRRPIRRISSRVRQDALLRLWASGRNCDRRGGQPAPPIPR